VLRVLDTEHGVFVSTLSWLMVAQVVISQVLVWAALLTGRRMLYFYEELGWALIFAANTAASAYLCFLAGARTSPPIVLQLNLLFGAVYLPWQFFHLRMLRVDASDSNVGLSGGLLRAIRVRNRRIDAESWGGLVGLTWMFGYWATVIPAWVYGIVLLFADR